MTNYTQRRKPTTRDSGRGDSKQSLELHKTTCADCGKMCEVPFKPNGKKPVYCKDCFAKNGGQTTTNHFSTSPRREFAPSSFAPAGRPQNDSKKFDELARQLHGLNEKFDKLLIIAEDLSAKIK